MYQPFGIVTHSIGAVVAKQAIQKLDPGVKRGLINVYQLAGPILSPPMFNGDVVEIIARNTAYFNSADSNGKSKMVTEFSKVAWFNFLGGPRDLLVTTPHNQVAQ